MQVIPQPMLQKQQQRIIKKLQQQSSRRRSQQQDHPKKPPNLRKRQPLRKIQMRVEEERTPHPLKRVQQKNLNQIMEIAAVHRSKRAKPILCVRLASKDTHKTVTCSINARNHLKHLTTVS